MVNYFDYIYIFSYSFFLLLCVCDIDTYHKMLIICHVNRYLFYKEKRNQSCLLIPIAGEMFCHFIYDKNHLYRWKINATSFCIKFQLIQNGGRFLVSQYSFHLLRIKDCYIYPALEVAACKNVHML